VADRVPFIDLEPWVERVRRGDGADFGVGFPNDVIDLLDTREFLGGGPTTQKLEAALVKKLGAQHVVTCANGTDALQLALRASGIDHGTRVAMPNLTFWATYEAIVNVGATPVLIDIDPDDRQMSFEEFKRAHDERRFDAAILVHLYGWCSSRLEEYRAFCRERRITLIEDGAQAFGVEVTKGEGFLGVNRQSVFAEADVATLSFHPAKVLGGIGDGGAVVCKTTRMAARVRALANHGRGGHGQHEHVAAGWNSRLDAIQAVWLLRGLDVIDEVIEARRALHAQYVDVLTAMLFESRPGATTYSARPGGVLTNGYMNTVSMDRSREDKRKPAAEIVRCLAAQGIEARRIYPYTICDQADGCISFGSLEHSRAITNYVVSLPLYYGMTAETIERVAKAYVEATK
jgi:UDP-2-acetamido-2-deoxy-ribo-hexuluronate aminotransferase